MGYGDKIKLGEAFDNDSTLNTSVVKSDVINSNEALVEIQITVTGDAGDGDEVEVSFYSENNTEGSPIGLIDLNGSTTVRENFYISNVKSFRIGLNMEVGSIETPNFKGSYSVRD